MLTSCFLYGAQRQNRTADTRIFSWAYGDKGSDINSLRYIKKPLCCCLA